VRGPARRTGVRPPAAWQALVVDALRPLVALHFDHERQPIAQVEVVELEDLVVLALRFDDRRSSPILPENESTRLDQPIWTAEWCGMEDGRRR